MRLGRTILFTLLLVNGCVHANALVGGKSAAAKAEAAADSLYWSAVYNLDPSSKSGTLDAGVSNLDAYLASPGPLKHAAEAKVLRGLARNAQQLARVEAALQQERAAAETRARPDPGSKARDEEALKEIQRLKDELVKANAELDRIKKRLASPDKP